jgi:hypothetical protein
MDYSLQGLFELKNIPFPTIREWRLEAGVDLFDSLNLNAADSVSFFCMDYEKHRFFAPIPTQLTTLVITCVVFTSESLSSGQRHILPCLTSLSLEEVAFVGHIRKFFHCPKLENLRYIAAPDGLDDNPIVEGNQSHYMALIEQALDEAFFRETPALVSISLQGATLGDGLKPTLASCPVLRSLEILDCYVEKLIQPFLENLQDMKYFPSLEKLCIDDSWPTNLDISYDEFAARCRSERPGICVFSSGRQGWGYRKTSSDDGQSESDLGSDSEAESNEFGDGESDRGYDFYVI